MSLQDLGGNLHAVVQEVQSAIHQDLIPAADKMEEELAAEKQQVDELLDQLLEKITAARNEGHERAQAAIQALQDAQAAIADTADGLADRIREGTEAINTLREDMEEATEELHQMHEAHMQQLGAFDQDADKMAKEADAALQAWVANIEETMEAADNAQEAYNKVVEGMHAEVLETFKALDADVQKLGQETEVRLKGLLDQVDNTHGSIGQANIDLLLHHIVPGHDQGASTVKDGMEMLDRFGKSFGEAFDGDTRKLLEAVREVSDIIDEIKPILEIAKHI